MDRSYMVREEDNEEKGTHRISWGAEKFGGRGPKFPAKAFGQRGERSTMVSYLIIKKWRRQVNHPTLIQVHPD